MAMIARLTAPGFRYVTTVHGMLGLHHRRNLIYRVVDLVAGRFARTVIAVSEHGRDALVRAGSSKTRTVTITNGLAFTDLENLKAIASARSPRSPDDPIRLGFLGRLSPEKGTRELVDLVAAMGDTSTCLELAIAGDGPDRSWMAEAMPASSGSVAIAWRGAIDDVGGFLSDVDVLVMPSHNEGMPYALLEGMAAGCAAVAFQVGGIPEVVTEPGVGSLVAPGDVAGFIDAVIVLASDRENAWRIGAAASVHVRTEFALRTRLPAIIGAYGLDAT